MDPITPFDWHRIFIGTQPPLFFLEIVVRVILIYTFTILVLRYMGKRGQRQMTPFELVLVIALGSATGDSMFYPEVPIFYAWFIILLMVLLDRLLSELKYRFQNINTFLVGNPRLLVQDGNVLEHNLHKEDLRIEELMALLREKEISDTGELDYVFLETTGNLGLLRRNKADQTQEQRTYPLDSKA